MILTFHEETRISRTLFIEKRAAYTAPTTYVTLVVSQKINMRNNVR